MDFNKDYYAILGVTPLAEDIVIRAAYKALAQRYHPDRYTGEKDEVTRKMADINEAYGILSEEKKRKEYDSHRVGGTQDGEPYFAEDDEVVSSFDPLDRDWAVALRYYPDLEKIEEQLRQISWKLTYAYKAYLIETKQFDRRGDIANKFQHQFLETYFGSNIKIIEFALHLIRIGKRDAALELNETIRVLGGSVNPIMVIKQISNKYFPSNAQKPKSSGMASDAVRIAEEIKKLHPNDGLQLKISLVEAIGGMFGWASIFTNKRAVVVHGKRFVFENDAEFSKWVLEDVVPFITPGGDWKPN